MKKDPFRRKEVEIEGLDLCRDYVQDAPFVRDQCREWADKGLNDAFVSK